LEAYYARRLGRLLTQDGFQKVRVDAQRGGGGISFGGGGAFVRNCEVAGDGGERRGGWCERRKVREMAKRGDKTEDVLKAVTGPARDSW